MRKVIPLIFSAAVLMLLSTSCKKKTEDPPPSDIDIVTPLKKTVDSKTPVDVIKTQNEGAYDFGSKFFTSVNGKITKLGCMMPEAGTYTVTLWNFATQASLAQVNVSITGDDQFYYADITPVDITAGTRYVVSVNTASGGAAKQYYYLYKGPTSGSVMLYPFTVGRVTIEAPLSKSGAVGFPDYNNQSDFPFIRGVADVQFESPKIE